MMRNKISIQGNHVILNICGCDLEVDFLLTGINEDQRKDQKGWNMYDIL